VCHEVSTHLPSKLLLELHRLYGDKAKARRIPIASAKKPTVKGKASAVTTEDLSHRLASALTITKAKGTRNGVTPESTPERRVLAMRTVNNSSQGLSTVMKTGWKCPSEEPITKKAGANKHEAFSLATSARAALEDLRTISPGGVDVERAAIVVAGKLLSLDMVRSFIIGQSPRLILEVRTRFGRAFRYTRPTFRARELRHRSTS